MAQQYPNPDLSTREHVRFPAHDGQRSRISRSSKGKPSSSTTMTRTGSATIRSPVTRPPEISQEAKEGYSFFGFFNRQKPKIVESREVPESTPKHPNGSVVDLEDYFLQPAEESRIQRDVNQLKLFISSHVDDHYSGLTNLPPVDVMSNIVTEDDEETPIVAPLLREESVRLLAIRHCFARHIIECIAFDAINSDCRITFLPDDLVSLLEMVPQPSDRGKCRRVDHHSRSSHAGLTSHSSICCIRTITSDCRQPTTINPTNRKRSIY